MKKITILLLVLSSIFGCVSKKSADKLNQEKDSLAMIVASKDSVINDVFSSINLISENLDVIKAKEKMLNATATGGDVSKDKRIQISDDINAIGELLAQNRETIARLKGSTEKLRSANIKITELERLVETMTKQISEKDADIENLKTELAKMHFDIDVLNKTVGNLNSNVSQLESTVSNQTTALNSVYYIIGQEKDLVNNGIILKSGFIGRTLTINKKYDLNKFTNVSKKSLDKIVIGQKKITIVTSHPADSYELIMGNNGVVESLVIINADKFWESSKVLVISYK